MKHTHKISDFKSGYTDFEDGHRHSLYPKCPLCKLTRVSLFKIGLGFCEIENNHRHYFKEHYKDIT